jgi:hypothetical protein
VSTGEAGVDEPLDVTVNATEPPAIVSDAERNADNVFRTLGNHARTRSVTELWITTVVGAVDAGLLWWQHPLLSWVAAGCAAMAAYGGWGLLDRAASTKQPPATPDERGELAFLTGLRDLAAIVGTGAAFWAILSFMAAALGNWNH